MLFKKNLLSAALLLVLISTAVAQEVDYEVTWGAPNSHYFDVEMTFTNPMDGPVSVRIPAWRPGRYIIQNFAKNVILFSAEDGEGNDLVHRKTDKQTWEVDAPPNQTVVVRYKVWAFEMDAGNSYLDETEAYLNPITLLMYVPGYEGLPCNLEVEQPEGWKTATPLDPDQNGVYQAEDYHELVDSPMIISPTLDILSFDHGGARFEIAIQGEAKNYEPDSLLADFRAIVEVQTDIMAVIPFSRYVFLLHFMSRPMGHGVEHKNSTSIVIGPADFNNDRFYNGLLSVTAHEFFHVWNVERIRPEAIYEPDYSEEAYTTTMWLYEGVTSYYTGLTLMRAGLITEEQYLGRVAGTIRSYETQYGRNITSVAMTSWNSWAKQGHAPPHTYYSFYTAGSVLGTLLDLEVRGRTRNRESLDGVMRYLYRTYAARDRGVPEDGFQRALEEITSGSFEPFFSSYVHGLEEIPYDRFLFHAGYELEIGTDESRSPVVLGVTLSNNQEMPTVESVVPESAAFKAGLDIGDQLVAIDGERVTNVSDQLSGASPGDTVEVSVFRRNELRSFQVVLDGGGNETYKIERLDDTSLLQNQIRRSWLGIAAG